MSVIPRSQRAVVPCPHESLPHARRALRDRLMRLGEEIEHCTHRALEINLPDIARSIESMQSLVLAANYQIAIEMGKEAGR